MIRIKEVTTRSDLKKFVRFPNTLYKDNEYYVPQIESMELDTLSPSKNAAFQVCEGKYWLALDDKGSIVGRVAGIINHRYNNKIGYKICRFGWLDYIDSQEVVDALMSVVEDYARSKEMEMMEGPVGFLEFDVTGILVEGFDKLPTAYGKYNYPYYATRLLAAGYDPGNDYVEYLITVPDNFDRYHNFAEIAKQRYGIHEAEYSSKKELVRKYADGIFKVMNEAYSGLHGYSELSPGQCEDLKRQFLPNLILDYVSIIVDAADEVVGFGIAMPSFSKALQKAGGHYLPFGWMHLLKALKENDTVDALLIAVRDSYRNKGVNAMILGKIGDGIHKNGIRYVESTRELEDNTRVQNMWTRMDRSLTKRVRVYTKEL